MAMMVLLHVAEYAARRFRPMTVFATYGVFTCIMANPVRMTLINSEVQPSASASFHYARRRTMA